MKTVLIGTSKGGQGKSSLVYHLSICGLLRGLKVAVIDSDAPQFTLYKVFGVRKELEPDRKLPEIRCLSSESKNAFYEELSSLNDDGFDLVLIDVGGHLSTGIIDATEYANLWVIPVEPTMENFWGVEDSLKIKTEAEIRILPNKVPLKSNAELKRVFAGAAEKLPLMNSVLHNRPFVPTASFHGKGVTEYRPGHPACDEMWAVFDEMMEVLKNA